MAKVSVWTRLALSDLGHAYDYISENGSAAPARVIDRIERALGALLRHPEIGRVGRLEGTRELVVPGTPFIIPYRIESSRIEVLAIIHAARRWPESL